MQKKKRLSLAWQVVIAAVLGVIFGMVDPHLAAQFQKLGDVFVNMIKMIITPLLFVIITLGIAGMGDVKKVGKVGGKAVLYFEVLTTIAIVIGLVAVNVLHPGSGLDMSHLAKGDISKYTSGATHLTVSDFLVNIVPTNIVDSLAKGDMLQVLFFATLFGLALAGIGEKGKPVVTFFDSLAQGMYKLVDMVMKLSPFGVFGAMSYTIGKFGIKSLLPLGQLVGTVYLTSIIFVVVVLGIVCKMHKFSLWKLLKYIKEELIVVLGTSSSESVLPNMMEKMERYGASRSIVSLVIPTGYSFNLDGTSIYLSIAAVFIAQLFGVQLDLMHQLEIVGILMLTSKGAAAVTGGGFITLAATLAATHVVPVEGLALILGVDRFLSMSRAIINLIGNAVATVVVAKWEKEFDEGKMQAENQLVANKATVNA
jgi:aerobic C4-dicarboxylate transport protein